MTDRRKAIEEAAKSITDDTSRPLLTPEELRSFKIGHYYGVIAGAEWADKTNAEAERERCVQALCREFDNMTAEYWRKLLTPKGEKP